MFLLLGVLLGISRVGDALSKQFLDPITGVQLMQAAVSVFDQTVSEGAKTKLSHRSVEQDLGRNIHMADAVLEVQHHHHISSLVESLVKRVEVDVAKHRASLQPFVAMSIDDRSELIHELL